MCLVRREAGFPWVAAAGSLFALFLFVLFFLLVLCCRFRVAILVPFRFLRGRLVDVLVDILDLLLGIFLVGLALQFGELFAQLGYPLVFFFKLDAHLLALIEDHCDEFGLGQDRKPGLVRAGWSIAFHGGGCHVVKSVSTAMSAANRASRSAGGSAW